MMAKRTVTVKQPKENVIEIPDEFPHGYGYSGKRESLSADQKNALQKMWNSLTDDQKVEHLLQGCPALDRTREVAETHFVL